MKHIWTLLVFVGVETSLWGTPITDPFVKNLTLVGVIHVEGHRSKGQSVAVLREKASGKTRILHKGDSILDADLEVQELGPQQITLMRGQEKFILRVENQPDTSAAFSGNNESPEGIDVESTEEVLSAEPKTSSTLEIPSAPPVNSTDPTLSIDSSVRTPIQRFEPQVIPEALCETEACKTHPE